MRYAPFCFTEQGVVQFSSVLNSERAIDVNIHIIRAFVKMRELISSSINMEKKIENIEKNYLKRDIDDVKNLLVIFKDLDKIKINTKTADKNSIDSIIF